MTDLQTPNGRAHEAADRTTNGHARAAVDPKASAASGGCGRDGRGRFAAGNKGGPGNPFARKVAGLRSALLEAVSPEDLTEIVGRVVEAAKAGDLAAARLVLAYTVGKPAAPVDPDRIDVGEWELWQQMTANVQALDALVRGMQVPLACKVCRASLPILEEIQSRQMAEQVREPAPARADAGGAPQSEAEDRGNRISKKEDEKATKAQRAAADGSAQEAAAGAAEEPTTRGSNWIEEADCGASVDEPAARMGEDQEPVKLLLELLREARGVRGKEGASAERDGGPS